MQWNSPIFLHFFLVHCIKNFLSKKVENISMMWSELYTPPRHTDTTFMELDWPNPLNPQKAYKTVKMYVYRHDSCINMYIYTPETCTQCRRLTKYKVMTLNELFYNLYNRKKERRQSNLFFTVQNMHNVQ